MTQARPTPTGDDAKIARMPSWVALARGESAGDVAFLSGAALAVLDVVAADPGVPHALLRDRRALAAAEASVRFSGRSERASDLRDEVHLLRPGERPGPAGAVFDLWRRAVRVPLGRAGTAALARLLPEAVIGTLPAGPGQGRGPAVDAAAGILGAVLAAHPCEEAAALILADATLARGLGWPRVLPLIAAGLDRHDLSLGGADLRSACHRAVLASAIETHRMAQDLARRAAHLRRIAPSLRARGAEAAVELFLAEDAVAPSVALSPVIRGSAVPMTDRAARRLCERLVDLGAVREMTGRPGFRLYGV